MTRGLSSSLSRLVNCCSLPLSWQAIQGRRWEGISTLLPLSLAKSHARHCIGMASANTLWFSTLTYPHQLGDKQVLLRNRRLIKERQTHSCA